MFRIYGVGVSGKNIMPSDKGSDQLKTWTHEAMAGFILGNKKNLESLLARIKDV